MDVFLKEELKRRVRANPRYSLRSFARHLKLSPGALSEILRGQRDLSLRPVPSVSKAIGLNAAEARQFLRLAQTSKAAKNKELCEIDARAQIPDELIVKQEIFDLVSEWYHFAILNLMEVAGFQWSSTWIAQRLGLTRVQAQMAMDLLLKLHLVERQNGRYQAKSSSIVSPGDIPSAAVRGYHRQILEKAILALETDHLAEREFSGCGFAIDPGHLPQLKKELGQVQDELLAKYAKGVKTEVYFLEFALFKLTQRSLK